MGGCMRTLCAMAMLSSVVLWGAQGQPQIMVEWNHTGSAPSQTKYSAAADISPSNVGRLDLAWQWRPKEVPLPDQTQPGNFQATPLMVDNVLYLSTPFNRVVALNAETGNELWTFDPKAYLDGPGLNLYYQHRGVAFWHEGNESRVFMNSHDRLFSVDTRTGELVTRFGQGGYAMLREGLRNHDNKTEMRQSSPPVIYKNLVIVGSSIPDRLQYKGDPPGTIQAFDVRTGKRVWVFYTIPQPGEFGNETWENDSWAVTGHVNVWGPMSLDETRGLLYVPTSTPSSDYYGGRRPGANLFAETLLCLDAATGNRKWHFQAVHHGLWDYDFPAPPNLVTITVDGRRIHAVAQVSKQAFTYVFDRVPGQPVWPIVERPFPPGDAPGEWYAPTQPFPTRPPAYDQQGMTINVLIDFTPELRQRAIKVLNQYKYGPLFTPPSPGSDAPGGTKGTILMPGTVGGANWNGAGADPETGMLYVPTVKLPVIIELVKSKNPNSNLPLVRRTASIEGSNLELGDGLPIVKPPYGSLVAIDLNKGEIAGRAVNGNGPRDHPALKSLNLPPLGQPGRAATLVTRTLVFLGEGGRRSIARIPTWAGGKMFRA